MSKSNPKLWSFLNSLANATLRDRGSDFWLALYSEAGFYTGTIWLPDYLNGRAESEDGVPEFFDTTVEPAAVTILDAAASSPVCAFFTIGSTSREILAKDGPAAGRFAVSLAADDDLAAPIGSIPHVTGLPAGTLIETPKGVEPVEALEKGAYVLQPEGAPRQIVWTGSRIISGARMRAMPDSRPVQIEKDALGPDLPSRPTMLPPQHRFHWRVLAYGNHEAADDFLVAPSILMGAVPRVSEAPMSSITYHHVALSGGGFLVANGLACECLPDGTSAEFALGPQLFARYMNDRLPAEAESAESTLPMPTLPAWRTDLLSRIAEPIGMQVS
jgi:hypothetical protein